LRNYPISCPELTGGCRRQPGVRRLPVKLWLIDSRRKSGEIFNSEYGGIVIVTTPSDPPLPADLAAAHAMILAQREQLTLAKSEVTVGRLEIERLKLMLAKARREQFGQSSERGKLLVEQLELAIEDLEETQAEQETKAEIAAPEIAKQKRAQNPRPPRRPLPDNLPVERIVEPAPCACGKCGSVRLHKLGEVVSKTLECEPRRWKIIEHVREKFSCRDCEAITEAPAPSHPIPRGFAGPSLLAMVLVNKFLLHQPLNRQSKTYAREGIEIDVSTLADRVGACVVALEPLIEAIRTHVMRAERIHADDTTVPVLAKMKAVVGRIWTYVRDDRPFAGNDPPAALFYYSRNRAGEHPQGHLAGYVGLMQADAFNGYNDLYRANRKPAPILEAACWSHGRESSSTWRNLDRRRLPARPCGASISCSRSSAPSTAKRRNSGLPCVVRSRGRSSPISKPRCASSEPCSHQEMIPQRRSTTCSTAGRRSPASWTMAASASLTTLLNERYAWTFAGSDERASYCPSGYLLIN
jgi:transposase